MNVGRVVGREEPGGQSPHDSGAVADTEIEYVVRACVGAVDVINRAAPHMLPVEIQESANRAGQMILGKDVGFVIGNTHKAFIVGSRYAGVREFRTKNR